MKHPLRLHSLMSNALWKRRDPIFLIHFVTERCNARCPHCFIDFSSTAKPVELSLEEIEKIASTSGSSLANVNLTGGEPFLRDDLAEIANIWFANSTVQSMVITTNGSLPERVERFLEKTKELEKKIALYFSYDLIGEDFSDYRKIKGLHEKVFESHAIASRQGRKTGLSVNITLSEINIDCAEDVYDHLLHDKGCRNIGIVLVREAGAYKLDKSVKSKIASAYRRLMEKRDGDIRAGRLDGLPRDTLAGLYINAKNKLLWKQVLDTFVDNSFITPCRAGTLLGIIYSNGNAAPCEVLEDVAGNLREYDFDFSALWNSPRAHELSSRIVREKCRCTFECAWSVNMFASPKFYPALLYEGVSSLLHG